MTTRQTLSRRKVFGGTAHAGGQPNRSPAAPSYQPGPVASRPEAVYVETPQGRRLAGFIRPDGDGGEALVRRIRLSKHLARFCDGWGFQAELVPRLRGYGVSLLEVEDLEEGVLYRAPVDVLERFGIARDLGHGPQVFLSRRYWDKQAAQTFADASKHGGGER